MDHIQKIAIPIGIGAAIIGVWAALRKQTPSQIVVQGSSSGGTVGAPQIPLLTPITIPLEGGPPDPAAEGQYGGLSPSYVAAGFGSPLSQGPITGATWNGTGLQGTPSYRSDYSQALPRNYISALPPWKKRPSLQAAQARAGVSLNPDQKAGGCGCGGGCGGGGSTGTCPVGKQCNGLIDGAGAGFQPLWQKPTVPGLAFRNGVVYSVETQIVQPSPASYGAPIDHVLAM